MNAPVAAARNASRDLGPLGVRVNMMAGGLLHTTKASAATPEAVFDTIAGPTLPGYITAPEEPADAVVFFASPWSHAVTGQILVVDGGPVRD